MLVWIAYQLLTEEDSEDHDIKASQKEIDYLCGLANSYFGKQIAPADVVWSYSGVRPLYDDGASKAQEATRDYVLHLDEVDGKAPLLSIFGGKITTYRRLALHALERLGIGDGKLGADWTAKAPSGDRRLFRRP